MRQFVMPASLNAKAPDGGSRPRPVTLEFHADALARLAASINGRRLNIAKLDGVR